MGKKVEKKRAEGTGVGVPTPMWAHEFLPLWALDDCEIWRGAVLPDGTQPVLFRTPKRRGGIYVGGPVVQMGMWEDDRLQLDGGAVDREGRPAV